MRLRQVCLVASELESTISTLTQLLDAEVCFRDPGVKVFGLVNALVPVGSDFLEVVAPQRADSAGQRHIDRRGPGGYMLLLQCADGLSARKHALAQGAKAVWQHDENGIHATHFHPRSLPGAIVSVDSMDEASPDYTRPDSRWDWAGPDWKSHVRKNGILGLGGAVIQSQDPTATAERWQRTLNQSKVESNTRSLRLDTGEIVFAPGEQEDATFSAFCLRHARIPEVLARAQEMGLPTGENEVSVAGIRMQLEPRAGD